MFAIVIHVFSWFLVLLNLYEIPIIAKKRSKETLEILMQVLSHSVLQVLIELGENNFSFFFNFILAIYLVVV